MIILKNLIDLIQKDHILIFITPFYCLNHLVSPGNTVILKKLNVNDLFK